MASRCDSYFLGLQMCALCWLGELGSEPVCFVLTLAADSGCCCHHSSVWWLRGCVLIATELVSCWMTGSCMAEHKELLLDLHLPDLSSKMSNTWSALSRQRWVRGPHNSETGDWCTSQSWRGWSRMQEMLNLFISVFFKYIFEGWCQIHFKPHPDRLMLWFAFSKHLTSKWLNCKVAWNGKLLQGTTF